MELLTFKCSTLPHLHTQEGEGGNANYISRTKMKDESQHVAKVMNNNKGEWVVGI